MAKRTAGGVQRFSARLRRTRVSLLNARRSSTTAGVFGLPAKTVINFRDSNSRLGRNDKTLVSMFQ
jgi:hypothetical protein